MTTRQMLVGSATKAVSLDTLQSWEELGRVPWADSTESPLTHYGSVAYFYRCVEIRANTLSSMPWEVTRNGSEVWSSDESMVPKPLRFAENIRDLLWRLAASLSLVSTAYIHKLKNTVRVTDLRWLAPYTMTPIWSVDGISHFEREANKVKVILPADDVAYLWLTGQHETAPRPAPAQAAMDAAGVSANVSAFAKAFFERGAIKATILTVDDHAFPEDIAKIESWWNRSLSGVKNAWQTKAVGASVKPIVIGDGIKELDNTSLSQEQRENIATAFGVPHSLLMSNAANFATAEQDWKNFYDLTMIPLAGIVERQLNRDIFDPAGYQLRFMPESLSVFQADEQERSGAFANYVNAGMSQSIAAQVLGITLPEGIDYDDLDSVSEPQPSEEIVRGAEEEADETERATEAKRFRKWLRKRPNDDGSSFKSDVLDENTRAEILSAVRLTLQLDSEDDEAERDARLPLEEESAEDIARALQSQLSEILKNGDFSPTNRGDFDRIISDASPKVRAALRRMLIKSGDLGIKVAVGQLDSVSIGVAWDLAHADAIEFVNGYASKLMDEINETTGKTVRQSVLDWIDSGESLPALQRELSSGVGAPFSRQRAELIASTEVTKAYAQGQKITFRRTGVIEASEWRTANDERVCPICGPLSGVAAHLDGEFEHPGGDETQDKFSGNTYEVPPAHPRCRCWIVPVI